MLMRKLVMFTGAIAMAGSVPAFAQMPAPTAANHTKAQVALEKDAVDALEQMEEVASEVHYHAERLVGFAQSHGISPWTHDHHLEMIKELVNSRLQPALKKLTTLQTQIPEWKEGYMDRMLASARDLAADTTSAFAAKTTYHEPAAVDESGIQEVRHRYVHALRNAGEDRRRGAQPGERPCESVRGRGEVKDKS